MKDLWSNMEGKTNFFRGAYRLSGTWIVECLDLTDPDPHILRQIYATGGRGMQQAGVLVRGGNGHRLAGIIPRNAE